MSRIHAAAAALGLAAVPALAAVTEPAGVARNLRAGADEEPAFMLSANGANVFQCNARIGEPGAYAWSFVAPDATLLEGTRAAGSHRAPGQFESDSDRSSVSGVLQATQPGGRDNLPWARMRAVPAGDSGMFAGVTTIQRVNTSGGVAPADGCAAASVGNEARVNFTADYYFYKRRGTT
jgi:hypothetical protein